MIEKTENNNSTEKAPPDNLRVFKTSEKPQYGVFESQEELDQFIANDLMMGQDPNHFEYPYMYELHKLAFRLDGMGVKEPEEAIHRVLMKLGAVSDLYVHSMDEEKPEFDDHPFGAPEDWYPTEEEPPRDICNNGRSDEGTSSVHVSEDAIFDPSDGTPPMLTLAKYISKLPSKAAELIQGILRVGHKMLISGCSKAGKTFLLMYLAIAIAEGTKWLGFQCRKGRVLYINLEIDSASAINRFHDLYKALGISPSNSSNILIWNLRGYAKTLDKLVPVILNRLKGQHIDAIIIDPIYKVIMGDENSATDMGKFCNEFDKLCTTLGCSVIMCHHHSKGAQGGKKARDRSSGSGVFSRDPDAILDIIELEMPEELTEMLGDANATAWRMESTLREFANVKPINIIFQYPIHKVDESGLLADTYPEGSPQKNLSKSSKYSTAKERRNSIINAYTALEGTGPVKIKDMASYLKVGEGTIRNRIKELNGEFIYEHGLVKRKSAEASTDVSSSEIRKTSD